jgi:hypothetical protein
VPEREFSEEEIDAALQALSEPERFREAEARVARKAPELQHVLVHALEQGGYFDQAHEQLVRQAVSHDDLHERLVAVRTLLAEETRMGMLVGVAVGWELARELEMKGES